MGDPFVMTMPRTSWVGGGVSALAMPLALTLALAGCGDVLKVTNPGPIPSTGLNDPNAATSVVSGISYELSYNLNGVERFAQSNVIQETGVIAKEIIDASGGGFFTNDGKVSPVTDDVEWSGLSETRWVAEHGVAALQISLGAGYKTSLLAARANLLAGVANRFLGENSCQAVIDGGPAQDRSVYFQRAETYFTSAIAIDNAAGDSSYSVAGHGGRAAVRAWQGNWAGALADAALVPTKYEYDAVYNGNNLINNVASQTHVTHEFTVFGTPWAADSLDPRTPSVTLHNADGTVVLAMPGEPMQQQNKYTDIAQSVPLVHGTEMRLLEAENALMAGDIGGAFTSINTERAFYGLPPLAVPADLTTAWATLQLERGAVLWLEARRLWDLSRWFAATGPEHNDTLNGRATCLPIGQTELQSNPNLHGG